MRAIAYATCSSFASAILAALGIKLAKVASKTLQRRAAAALVHPGASGRLPDRLPETQSTALVHRGMFE